MALIKCHGYGWASRYFVVHAPAEFEPAEQG